MISVRWLGSLLFLGFLLAGCGRDACPRTNIAIHRNAIILDVLRPDNIREFSDVQAAEVLFDERGRMYDPAAGIWVFPFEVRGRRYNALIGCNNAVELSMPPQPEAPIEGL